MNIKIIKYTYLVMNIKYILFFNFFILLYGDKILSIVRNSYLRLYISNYKKKYSIFNSANNLQKISSLYNSILSKYYDISSIYYSLSDDEKILVDSVISLLY